jgi:hypothetical protein
MLLMSIYRIMAKYRQVKLLCRFKMVGKYILKLMKDRSLSLMKSILY